MRAGLRLVPVLVGALAAVSAAAVACGDDEVPVIVDTTEARSDVPRDTSPDVTESQRAEFQAGNTAFAIDLYRALASEEGNLFFSPHSISTALGMTWAGARGDTATEMADTLHFTLPAEPVHAGFNALDLDLEKRPAVPLDDPAATPPELSVANSTWGAAGHPFLPEFLDVLARDYDAGMRLVDFANEPEGARLAINQWVSDETRERIKDLIPEGVISPATRLVLANAIYFKGSWASPFIPDLTTDAPFTLLDGTKLNVPTMYQLAEARYAEVDGLQAVELRYVGDEIAMVVVLPPEGGFQEMEGRLDPSLLDLLDASWQEADIDLSLPKFTFESQFQLNEVLSDLGMPSAFDPGRADFSGMDGAQSLFISAVLHKAFVAVDEKGTEAAAATAVVMDESAPSEITTLFVNRPFLFLIRDIPTGAVLFVGRVVDPSN